MENNPLTPENRQETALLPEEGEGAPAEETVAMSPAAEVEEPNEEGAGELPERSFAEQASEDLAALRAALPELAGLSSLTDLSDPQRFGELRELGLSPLEAYLATEGNRKRSRGYDSRAHLTASVGRAAGRSFERMSAAELEAARDLFPSLSDGEIEALRRRVEDPRRR